MTTSSAIPHFKDKSLQFLVFNFISSKNLLQVRIFGNVQNKMKFNQSGKKCPSFNFFLNEECLGLKSIKGQFWDLAVLILQLLQKRNLERYFLGFVCFFKKKLAKKWNFDQNRINFTNTLVILTKKLSFLYLNKNQ